ncbi:hypothetical protein DJ031_10720 [bacterium endosymbiont of Escarpia laminata]|nr:MAG: hypothetical protein DJ031_10720 [bacterium endosymbiont of Escarpia laminata]
MAMNPIQFQAGMSLSELFEHYDAEKQCEAALETARWPQGFDFTHCGDKTHSRFHEGQHTYWQCSAYRHQTSLRSGTIFHGSKLPLRKWFQAMFLISQSKNNNSYRNSGLIFPRLSQLFGPTSVYRNKLV